MLLLQVAADAATLGCANRFIAPVDGHPGGSWIGVNRPFRIANSWFWFNRYEVSCISETRFGLEELPIDSSQHIGTVPLSWRTTPYR